MANGRIRVGPEEDAPVGLVVDDAPLGLRNRDLLEYIEGVVDGGIGSPRGEVLDGLIHFLC